MAYAINCSIALIFIIAMIWMSLAIDENELVSEFKQKLTQEQRELYSKIVNQRRNIYFVGYLLGVILSIGYILFFNPKIKSTLGLICLVISITFLTSYFFYILYPKENLIVLYLDSEEQRKEWIKVYKTMQFHYHLGLVLGIIAVVFLGTACHSHKVKKN